MTHRLTLSQAFVGTDVEALQPVKSEVLYTTYLRGTSESANRRYWQRLNAALDAEYARAKAERAEASAQAASAQTADGYETYVCAYASQVVGHKAKSYRRSGTTVAVCKPCRSAGRR
jgi:hypothetical protein